MGVVIHDRRREQSIINQRDSVVWFVRCSKHTSSLSSSPPSALIWACSACHTKTACACVSLLSAASAVHFDLSSMFFHCFPRIDMISFCFKALFAFLILGISSQTKYRYADIAFFGLPMGFLHLRFLPLSIRRGTREKTRGIIDSGVGRRERGFEGRCYGFR